MRFDQVLVSASAGDAITNMALELRSLLRSAGPSEVYALHIDPRLVGDVLPIRQYVKRSSAGPAQDVLIFHASIGEPEVTALVASRPERLVVLYHNISPWERFLPFDPPFAGLLAAGRIELASLADKAVLALTVSEYNAAELRAAGFRNVQVAPLVVDIARLQEVESDPATANHMENGIDGPVVLFVGQMLPHKRPDLLIQAYHVLITHLLPDAHLVMVGPHRLPRFRDHLLSQLKELNLNRSWLAGSVSLEQLVAIYRGADVFVTLSEHEGFCVPVLEAMGFDIPVIARSCAAIPETVGDAGVLLPDAEDPLLAAEAMAEVIGNQALRNELVTKGRQRIARFDPDVARAELLTHIFSAAAS